MPGVFLKRRPIDWLLGLAEAGAFLTAVFSLATVFDHLHRALELFSHFRLQYLVVSVLLFLVLAAFRRRGMAILMLVVSLVNVALVAPWYWPRTDAGESASLVLLHANILVGNDDTGRLLEQIEREQPDLVFVQELNAAHLRRFESLAATYPYALTRPHDDPFGLGAWSKHPFIAADVIVTPPLDNPSLRIEIEFDGASLTLYSTHPVPPIGGG